MVVLLATGRGTSSEYTGSDHFNINADTYIKT